MFSTSSANTLEYLRFHCLEMTFLGYVSVVAYSDSDVTITVDLTSSQLDKLYSALVGDRYHCYDAIY